MLSGKINWPEIKLINNIMAYCAYSLASGYISGFQTFIIHGTPCTSKKIYGTLTFFLNEQNRFELIIIKYTFN